MNARPMCRQTDTQAQLWGFSMIYFAPDRHLRGISDIYSRIWLKLSTTAEFNFRQF
jgi:hypothetical protein